MGWAAVPSQQLRLGSNGPAVSALRRRLIVSGDIGAETGTSPVFDSYVEAAVRRFQARHGIIETASVNQQTLTALISPPKRVSASSRPISCACAAFPMTSEIATSPPIFRGAGRDGEAGQVVSHHIAGVGKIDRRRR